MISTVTTIDNRKFLKEAVRDYLEEYKIERYKREQEEKIEKNVQNLLFEQALSLDDIASGFSVDPFSGEKINMAEVTPPVTKKYAMAKGKKLPKDDRVQIANPFKQVPQDQSAPSTARYRRGEGGGGERRARGY